MSRVVSQTVTLYDQRPLPLPSHPVCGVFVLHWLVMARLSCGVALLMPSIVMAFASCPVQAHPNRHQREVLDTLQSLIDGAINITQSRIA